MPFAASTSSRRPPRCWPSTRGASPTASSRSSRTSTRSTTRRRPLPRSAPRSPAGRTRLSTCPAPRWRARSHSRPSPCLPCPTPRPRRASTTRVPSLPTTPPRSLPPPGRRQPPPTRPSGACPPPASRPTSSSREEASWASTSRTISRPGTPSSRSSSWKRRLPSETAPRVGARAFCVPFTPSTRRCSLPSTASALTRTGTTTLALRRSRHTSPRQEPCGCSASRGATTRSCRRGSRSMALTAPVSTPRPSRRSFLPCLLRLTPSSTLTESPPERSTPLSRRCSSTAAATWTARHVSRTFSRRASATAWRFASTPPSPHCCRPAARQPALLWAMEAAFRRGWLSTAWDRGSRS
mmetsp:Transcript_19679/g.38253  ORF Transcript_19679/g.38253 Transcript_19679/m.38253 type:complete len:353 (+) Transcript_19679:1229-2287(+)